MTMPFSFTLSDKLQVKMILCTLLVRSLHIYIHMHTYDIQII